MMNEGGAHEEHLKVPGKLRSGRRRVQSDQLGESARMDENLHSEISAISGPGQRKGIEDGRYF